MGLAVLHDQVGQAYARAEDFMPTTGQATRATLWFSSGLLAWRSFVRDVFGAADNLGLDFEWELRRRVISVRLTFEVCGDPQAVKAFRRYAESRARQDDHKFGG